MSFILGVGGSPRKGGNSDTLLRAMLEGAGEAGAGTRAVFLRDFRFDPCIGCERCRRDKACTGLYDGMTLLYPDIERASGLILATPVHHYNVSALLKAFIDRLYCYYDFTDDRPRGYSSRLAGKGRKAMIAGVCEQPEPEAMGATMDMMRRPLEVLGYEVLDDLAVYGIFDSGRVKTRPEIMAGARELGRRLGKAID